MIGGKNQLKLNISKYKFYLFYSIPVCSLLALMILGFNFVGFADHLDAAYAQNIEHSTDVRSWAACNADTEPISSLSVNGEENNISTTIQRVEGVALRHYAVAAKTCNMQDYSLYIQGSNQLTAKDSAGDAIATISAVAEDGSALESDTWGYYYDVESGGEGSATDGYNNLVTNGPTISWSGICGDTLTDKRGGVSNTYTTAEITGTDNKTLCWMTQNLDLPGGTTVTPADSNVSSSYSLPSSRASGFSGGIYNSNNTTCRTTSSNSNTPCYSYYSWAVTKAGNRSSTYQNNDICPKDWRLPTQAELDALSTSDYSYFRNIGYPGRYYSDSFTFGGSGGFYWSGTPLVYTHAYYLYINSSSGYVDYLLPDYGLSVRCVAQKNEPISVGTSITEAAIDSDVYKELEQSNGDAAGTAKNLTFGVKVDYDSAKPDGTYTNQIKLTLVAMPKEAITYTVSYDKNDSAATGTAPATQTTTLYGVYSYSGFTAPEQGSLVKEGYVLKGWHSDSAKATNGEVEYEPGDPIPLTATSGSNSVTLTLYAVWRLGKIYMQDMTFDQCTTEGIEVYDKRNESIPYTVKLIQPSGLASFCWMTSNLKLPAGTYDSSTTNVTSSYELPSTAWSSSSQNDYCKPYMGIGLENGEYYYNWPAATARNNTTSNTSSGCSNDTNNSLGDICPKGWRLPTAAETDNSTWLSSVQLSGSLGYTGYFASSSTLNVDTDGHWWASTWYGNSYAYSMYYSSGATRSNIDYKYNGFSVRCVAD